ncbi:helix-turn-helix domain-containing protein [Mucilaginibacter pallidiroseus]|uniref:Helix-turn-helix domain-containing protein n=1 Tax=Mucilaginibacter pallidiroseus TaxID=2599295 RepID=A0A563U088_9SPHI|nr:helix-turn-helix domain-containing protein [Mucilaginibacter pallidiroseus]TWR24790.1 helix-turn-helix domain-containing protein [Mucilaginibacter pallidiroseus]
MANQNEIQHDFPKVNRDQLITVQDLLDFKQQLIVDIKKLLKEQTGQPGHHWLKAFEIKKMLRLSESKLQYLRDKGLIPFKKLGGITYYNSEEIEKLMASGKLNDQMKMA